MISLVIKGDSVAAFAAADRHKVELTSIQTNYRSFGSAETYASCDASALNAVIAWYCACKEVAPYSTGTLLLYTNR
jgi:hypothetical protein